MQSIPNLNEPDDLNSRVIAKGLLDADEVTACRFLQADIENRFGLVYTFGQILCERIYHLRGDLRESLLTHQGRAGLFGDDVRIDFWKFTADSHDRFVAHLKREGNIPVERYHECFRVLYDLSQVGVVRQIGEILVDRGYADRILAEEYLRPPADPERLPAMAFDRVAVTNGFVTEGAAATARQLQEKIRDDLSIQIPIGRILHETGHLRMSEVAAILDAQVRIGRLPSGDSSFRILKLSDAEREPMRRRLEEAGVSQSSFNQADNLAGTLREYGLDFEPVEVLWLQKKIPEGVLDDVLAFQGDHLARLEPRKPDVALTIGPSVGLLLKQRPADVLEADFLFGQCARLNGAISRDDLEQALQIYRACRKTLDFSFSLGQILYDLHGEDTGRFERLQQALIEVRDRLGYDYEVSTLHLSPLELETVSLYVKKAGDELSEAMKKAEEQAATLSELGLEKKPIELLLHRGVLAETEIGDLLGKRGARDRRLVGGWREREAEARSAVSELFARAWSIDGAARGWSSNLLGCLAIREGLIDPPDLIEALYVQMRARELGFPRKIGEILADLGSLTEEQVEWLGHLQSQLGVARPKIDPASKASLKGEDRVLHDRLLGGVILDEDELNDLLRDRAALRQLGLSGSFRRIVRDRGVVEPEIIDALMAGADVEERRAKQEAPSAAVSPTAPSAAGGPRPIGPPADFELKRSPTSIHIRRAYRQAVRDAHDTRRITRPPEAGRPAAGGPARSAAAMTASPQAQTERYWKIGGIAAAVLVVLSTILAVAFGGDDDDPPPIVGPADGGKGKGKGNGGPGGGNGGGPDVPPVDPGRPRIENLQATISVEAERSLLRLRYRRDVAPDASLRLTVHEHLSSTGSSVFTTIFRPEAPGPDDWIVAPPIPFPLPPGRYKVEVKCGPASGESWAIVGDEVSMRQFIDGRVRYYRDLIERLRTTDDRAVLQQTQTELQIRLPVSPLKEIRESLLSTCLFLIRGGDRAEADRQLAVIEQALGGG